MTKKQFAALFIVVVGTSLLGSTVIGRALAPLVASAAGSSVVQAREIDIVDSSGRKAGAWTPANGGGSEIVLYDARGQRVVRIQSTIKDSPNMVFFDASGLSRVGIGFASKDTPVVVLADAKAIPRANMRLENGSDPHLSLFDSSGASIWSAP